ncbi:MAG: 23S rRNA pseudouridine(1911/1915/1917) synthase RluD [Betaproteobacteria bacterium]|nr:23S rRNA pseudouridine(1911/1915/1917) synthase RluD [Betaproteobacteria bacterium]
MMAVTDIKETQNYSAVEGQERQVPADCAGMRFDQALVRMFPEHSRSRLAAWVKQGQLKLDHAAVEAKRKVWGGERVSLALQAEARDAAQQAEAIALEIVHEDAALLVLNKPAGLVVHPGSGNWQGTLLNGLLHHHPPLAAIPRAGIVHRLDKDTSGLLVVAKTLEAQTDLVRQLQARTVVRQYLALAHGVVARDGSVDAPIGRHQTQRTRMAVTEHGRAARTHYRVLERYANATLLECSLDTGRTHQIRVHLQSIGHPLVGDPVYRAGRGAAPGPLASFKRQALHAYRLGLVHPLSGAAMQWEAPLPADLRALLGDLAA